MSVSTNKTKDLKNRRGIKNTEDLKHTKGPKATKNMNKRSGLFKSFLKLTMIPLVIFGLITCSIIYIRFRNIINNEIKEQLKATSMIVENTYDYGYPGDYKTIGKEKVAVVKGDKVLNGNTEIIDEIKSKMDCEITIFYQNTRIISTISDTKKVKVVGSTARTMIADTVLIDGKEKFYSNSKVGEKDYLTFYKPIRNSDGSIVGMIAVGKSASMVKNKILKMVLPIISLVIEIMLLMVLLSYKYSNDLIKRIGSIKKYLLKTSEGIFNEELPFSVVANNDEISDVGKSITKMKNSIQKLVEKDTLTEINNRRYGEKYLLDYQKKSEETGEPFTVVIGDIDFFKKVNDNYGHECGDNVLKRVAHIMNSEMVGKGFVARWGGEEFLLVYEHDDLSKAYESLSNIEKMIRGTVVKYNDKKIRVTMTFGMCEGTQEPVNLLIKTADQNLYIGKQSGRNRIIK